MGKENRIKARTLLRSFIAFSYDARQQKEIGQGEHGIVYDMGDMIVKTAQPMLFGCWTEVVERREWFRNEFRIGKELHQQGFPVPEMYKLDSYSGLPCLLREKIDGQTAQEHIVAHPDEESRILSHYEALLERVAEVGYIPDAQDLTNVIVESDSGKLYLIDFDLWTRNE